MDKMCAYFGPVKYEISCVGARYVDLAELEELMNNIDGVRSARREETPSGFKVVSVLDEECNPKDTISEIRRTATGWFHRYNITFT
ncbi:MAG: hypothetical protein ABIQ64_02730 [Candidatus Saccharimonadales bacterium]